MNSQTARYNPLSHLTDERGLQYKRPIMCVYKFLNKYSEIIYIGKSRNLEYRLIDHKHLPPECYDSVTMIKFCTFNNEYELDLAERYFIFKFKPKYNTVLYIHDDISKNLGLDCLEWETYGPKYFIDFQIKFKHIWQKVKYIENGYPNNQLEKLEQKTSLLMKHLRIQESFCNNIYKNLINKQEQYINTNDYLQYSKSGWNIFFKFNDFTKTAGWFELRDNNHGLKYAFNKYANSEKAIKELNEIRKTFLDHVEKRNILNKVYEIYIREKFYLICKEDEIDNIDYTTVEQMAIHNTSTVNELKELLIEEFIVEKLDDIKDTLDKNKSYNYTDTIGCIALEIQNKGGVWNSLFDEGNRHAKGQNIMTESRLNLTKQIIKEIDKRLVESYGKFTIETVTELSTYPSLDNRLSIPTSNLIKKIQ